MASLSTHLSLEEFHRLYDGVKPSYEYWYGEAIQKPMATQLHAAVQVALVLLLRARGWNPLSEVTLKLVSDAEPIPDLVARRKRAERESYPTKPVDLCIEIMSPEDRLKKTLEKGKHYLKWGIPNVWIIEPETRTAWMLTPAHPDGIAVPSGGTLVADGTEIGLPEIFAEVDQMFT